MAVVRWTFANAFGGTPYTFHINPDEMQGPNITKAMSIEVGTGPANRPILQEGGMSAPVLNWSGHVLTQEHYEKLEEWYMKRIFLALTDDIGRLFQGVITEFSPERIRRPFNPHYHRYSATFVCAAYRNASGVVVFGRLS